MNSEQMYANIPPEYTYEWDWGRAIHVNREITDEFVADLLPQILRLKQQSSHPIAIAIDSVGGSVQAAEKLLEVVRSPDQDGNSTLAITIAVNKAFSAGASLLTMGDYAVALPSAQILYHDLRYEEVQDVTPTLAATAATTLSRANDALALRLATSVVERLAWNYIDQSRTFANAKSEHSDFASHAGQLMAGPEFSASEIPRLDFAGFVCSLYEETSSVGDELLRKTISRLQLWRKLAIAYGAFQDRNNPDLQQRALFRDDNPLTSIVSDTFPDKPAFSWKSRARLKDDLALLLLLVLSQTMQDEKYRVTEQSVSDLMRNFLFFKELRQPDHVDAVLDVILQNDLALFGVSLAKLKEEGKQEEHKKLVLSLFPQAQLFWAFALVLCRNLLQGDNRISLRDARFLGLVDEVLGQQNAPESRRTFRRRMKEKQPAAATT